MDSFTVQNLAGETLVQNVRKDAKLKRRKYRAIHPTENQIVKFESEGPMRNLMRKRGTNCAATMCWKIDRLGECKISTAPWTMRDNDVWKHGSCRLPYEQRIEQLLLLFAVIWHDRDINAIGSHSEKLTFKAPKVFMMYDNYSGNESLYCEIATDSGHVTVEHINPHIIIRGGGMSTAEAEALVEEYLSQPIKGHLQMPGLLTKATLHFKTF